MNKTDRNLFILLFACGTILRFLLYWVNHPENSFDDHFEPILFIMEHGAIPAKDACWQCYHPPVFYLLSAFTGKLAVALGFSANGAIKLMQFVNCFYGIATLGIVFLIIQKLPITNRSRFIAFGTICFLPRHIYMSAINSNDTLSYLLVAISIYLLISALEKQFPFVSLILLSTTLTLAVFTKYTALSILATTAIILSVSVLLLAPITKKKALAIFAFTLWLPISTLSLNMYSNKVLYGELLPWNTSLYNPTYSTPRDDAPINFVSFTPWNFIRTPLIAPGNLHSFWTLIYSGMMFDTDPKFLNFLDKNEVWWDTYNNWYKMKAPFPGENPSVSILTQITGSGLILLGLFPLALMFFGGYIYVSGKLVSATHAGNREKITYLIFPALIIFNTIGIISLTIKMPVFCSMKPSYFLNSIPAFAFFLGIGLDNIAAHRTLTRLISAVFILMFVLSAIHIIHVSYEMSHVNWNNYISGSSYQGVHDRLG